MPAASLRAAAGAVSFLTRVPVGRFVDVGAADVARSTILFPVVGAGVGALAGGVAAGLEHQLPSFVTAALAVAVAVTVTGAMHLDALADTADALGASDRAGALAIMRDSRVGTFGAAALVLDLLVKVSCAAALLEGGHVVAAFVAAGALSRAVSPPLAALLPYPRAEGGPGSVLTGRTSSVAAAAALAVGVGIAFAVWWDVGYWLVAAAVCTAVAAALFFRRWLGGATGDCLGAATEVCETAVLIVAVALL
jgi:cobalamin 5'-phosphate synthase/cobalamin synthase